MPALIPALDSSQVVVQSRAISLLVTMVQQQNELVEDVVQLFSFALPQRVRAVLMQVLTQDLASLSLPALLAGLEDAHLVTEVSATLVCLARRNASWLTTVLNELLQALRVQNRRHGATITLIEDVITTGGAVRDATKALRAENASVSVVVCAIDRSDTAGGPLADVDLETRAVLTREQLANA